MPTSDILNALSSSGLGTGQGIDVTSTVNQLNTKVTALSNAIDALNDPAGTLSARAVSSSQPGIAIASASNSTPVGSHTIVVNNLATSSSYYSDPAANSTTTLAAGTFTIQVGSKPATAITIDA